MILLFLLPAAIIIPIPVAISVTVAIGMAITVAALVIAGTVEDKRHVAILLLLIQPVEFRKHRTVEQTGSDHEERPVGKLVMI